MDARCIELQELKTEARFFLRDRLINHLSLVFIGIWSADELHDSVVRSSIIPFVSVLEHDGIR